jgi:hypothetical protein
MAGWFSKKRNIAIAVVAAVMLVGAIVGVIWGVTHHTEGNRLEVCWHNGVAHYEPDQVERTGSVETEHNGCEETEEIIWAKAQVPLIVHVVDPSGELSTDPEDLQVATTLVRDYNAQVGFEFFRLSKQGPASVRFHPQAAYESGASDDPRQVASVPGWATHSKAPDGRLLCDVYVRGGLSVRYAYRVAFHEFGHCAGLAHDPDYRASIMHPFSTDDTESDFMLPTRLTDNDVALHQIYR